MNRPTPRLMAKDYSITPTFPFHLSHWVHDRFTQMNMHSHEFVELVVVLEGSATHVFDSKQYGVMRYRISPGDIFIVNPDEHHNYYLEYEETVEVVNLLFYPEIIDYALLCSSEQSELMDFFYIQPFLKEKARLTSILKLDVGATEVVRNLVQKIENEFLAKHAGYQILIKLMFNELILRLSRYYAERPKLVEGPSSPKDSQPYIKDSFRRVIGYIERHYNTDITLGKLVSIASCGERQLSRVFKETTGLSIINYIHKIRIEKAKLLLLHNAGIQISSVSAEVGFSDVSYFNKIFKRLVGISPREHQDLEQQIER
ncbi:helix-turn-helix domain-containing protein [Paenibacillus eucommiae]|uniref:AraC-like DNA-binding protein/mannose-6-phosphate isomerase-like protein (Cupin superfamily) n=1 Tax=Paenibacillus eucommiae TaxID=1355755 RepID=A0ABS4IMJ3_9BACL|nr:helix-turn-helix domain-containing protein [Paenibacillus eucommiae]MBP1988759.1 AraC-like DNA-binding protein/mannose-6-phosphate isomerase-like protein (cupin superfamily) [Paenibacillus eucommiae]